MITGVIDGDVEIVSEIEAKTHLEASTVAVNNGVDNIAPSLVITDNQAGTANNMDPTVLYTFIFSEAVIGFTVDDISVVGGEGSGLTAVSGAEYTLLVTADSNSTGSMTVDVDANVATDDAANSNVAATQSTQLVDRTADAGIILSR